MVMRKLLAIALGFALLAPIAANATYIPGPSVTAPGTSGSAAATMQGAPGGVPLPTAPSSAAAVACQGGTGSAITSVTTAAATVCAGTTGNRTFFNVQGTSGTVNGTALGGCTWDGSTPTSTAYDFALFGAGASTNSTGMITIPNNPIICVSFSGTLTIKATAIQTGTAP